MGYVANGFVPGGSCPGIGNDSLMDKGMRDAIWGADLPWSEILICSDVAPRATVRDSESSSVYSMMAAVGYLTIDRSSKGIGLFAAPNMWMSEMMDRIVSEERDRGRHKDA